MNRCPCGRPLSARSASQWWCSEDCHREAASATAHNPAEVETGLTVDQHRAAIRQFLAAQYR